MSASLAPRERSTRRRTQSEKAQNVDPGAELWGDSSSDDPDFGQKARKPASRFRKHSAARAGEEELVDEPTWLPEHVCRASSQPLDLKGASFAVVVGKRIRVFYKPDGTEGALDGGVALQPYIGLVLYAEEGRLFVVYDDDDDDDDDDAGVWVDAEDEWEWADGKVPAPPAPKPVPGAWRPGSEIGSVEKILQVRRVAQMATAEKETSFTDSDCTAGRASSEIESVESQLEFLVKWKDLSHRHCQWVPREVLDSNSASKQKAARFLAELQVSGQLIAPVGNVAVESADVEGENGGAGAYMTEYCEVERVIASGRSHVDAPPHYYVKWRGLPYASATWESCRTMLGDQGAIHRFRKLQMPPDGEQLRAQRRQINPSNFRPLDASCRLKGGRTLQPHQIEGINWLLFSWYSHRNVMLADEMGLGKTVQAIAALQHMRTHERMRGPFIVIAPLSTLSHWVREIETWTDFNVIMYHGSRESREIISKTEFFYDAMSTTRQDVGTSIKQEKPQRKSDSAGTIDVRVVVPAGFVPGNRLQISFDGQTCSILPPSGSLPGSSFTLKMQAATPAPMPVVTPAAERVPVCLPPDAVPGQTMQLMVYGKPVTFRVPLNAVPGKMIHLDVPYSLLHGESGARTSDAPSCAPPSSLSWATPQTLPCGSCEHSRAPSDAPPQALASSGRLMSAGCGCAAPTYSCVVEAPSAAMGGSCLQPIKPDELSCIGPSSSATLDTSSNQQQQSCAPSQPASCATSQSGPESSTPSQRAAHSSVGCMQHSLQSNASLQHAPCHGSRGSSAPASSRSVRPVSGGHVGAAYKFEILVTSYEMVREDIEVLRPIPWRCMIVDEVHRLKNKNSALAAELRTLRTEQMFMMTGTPLQNNTTELWTLLSLLDANLFPDLQDFLHRFGTLTGSEQVEELREAIRPYLLRRHKTDVQLSLAPLEETIIWVEMTLQQKRTYRAVLEAKRELLVQGVSDAPLPALLNVQMELRKCCDHPFLISGVEESMTRGMDATEAAVAMVDASGKLVLLDKLLPKLHKEGHRVLIFSQFVIMLHLLADFLTMRGFSYERLDGSVTGDARQAAIDRFCKPNSEIFSFLLSTRAGGVGINLTAADTCIIFDSDWNPQNDLQAMARSHRIGQTRVVKVFRLVTCNSYEQELVHSANRKLGLERAMSSSDSSSRGATSTHGAPRDRAEIDRMLRCGAQDISLDDDAAFRRFSEADIDTILQSSTSVDKSAPAVDSTFSKVSFVADGEQIDITDPNFWKKILPSQNDPVQVMADSEHSKRQIKQQERYGMVRMRDDDHGDWLALTMPPEKRRALRREDDEESSHEYRSGRRQYYRYDDDSDGNEDEAVVDDRLWGGAFSEGWRMHIRHAKRDGHYYYVSPAGDRFKSVKEAMAHAAPSAAPQLSHVKVSATPAIAAERKSVRQHARRNTWQANERVQQPESCEVAAENETPVGPVLSVPGSEHLRACHVCQKPLLANSADSDQIRCHGPCGNTFFWGQALWSCRKCKHHFCAECC